MRAGDRVIVLDNSQESFRIGKFVSYIKDTAENITFHDIVSGKLDAAFVPCNQDAPNFGNVQLTTWNKFTVVNKSTHEWILTVDNYSLDTLYFYYANASGQYNKIKSGRCLPLSSRKYKTCTYVFDLPVAAGDTAIFYLRVSSFFMQYPLKIYTKEAFIESAHKKDSLEGMYFGMMLLIVLYNLFLFIYVRDHAYFYYIIYVLFNALMIAQLKGYVADLWGDRFHFFWAYSPAIIALSSFMAVVFSQHILESKRYTPRLHKIMSFVFKPLLILVILLSIFGYNLEASLMNQIVGLPLAIIMYVTSIVIYRQGNKFVRFYMAACWAYFLGVIIYVLKAFTVLPFTEFTNNAIEIGSSVQLIMFSITIADKVNEYRKEKAAAQQELVESMKKNEMLITEHNRMLETKVSERTSELKKSLTNLELSQIELQDKNQIITREKQRSDELLWNILPEEVAEELKQKGSAEAKHYENVSVLFTDFKDFTNISEKMSPQQLVFEIHNCFKVFDEIVEKHNIEKIKTIGDSYMCAGGLPNPNNTHASDTVKAAIEIIEFMNDLNRQKKAKGLYPFEIRVGINSGPVVAGIVGIKKFAYDIWGDTVNIASRLENSGEPGKINISGSTYSLIKDQFDFTYRGKIAVKGKGEVDMYFVNQPDI
ncbi:MAG: hypothetical protein JNL57_05045 [Bacteroidetes bacterium]|nr:hypothetical protein [Bacteroidota bacterium]